MNATLESLQTRVEKLEQEITSLRQLMMAESLEESAAERGRRILRQAWRDKPVQKAAVAKAFAQMGIGLAPVSAEQLRQAMESCGVRAENNLLSRGIQEMREE